MFIFTHIEKCAGTSFNDILSHTFLRYIHITKNNFGGNELRNDLTLEQFQKIKKFFPSGIGGHSIRPYLRFLPQSNRLTFLRNPIDRYMSQYNHMIERGWATSFETFLNSEFYSNFMTKKISGINDFDLASFYLRDFIFIGDVGRYNQSLNYLQDVMNVRLKVFDTRKNQRKNNVKYLHFTDLSEKEKLRVEENNQLDIKLY